MPSKLSNIQSDFCRQQSLFNLFIVSVIFFNKWIPKECSDLLKNAVVDKIMLFRLDQIKPSAK